MALLNDGAPCEVKVSRTVLSGGKSGDDIKGLPIAKCDTFLTEKVRRKAERELKNRFVELIFR